MIAKADKAKVLHEQGKQDEADKLENHKEYIGAYLNGNSEGNVEDSESTNTIGPEQPDGNDIGGGTGGEEPTIPEQPDERPIVNKDTVSTTEHEKIIGKDELGNQVVVPKGFKIAEDSGSTVKEGIVIEDAEGNQFVWIPVSNINHDGSNKIKIDSVDEEGIEITLGRYTFNTSTGKKTKVQYGSQYTKTTKKAVAEGNVVQFKADDYCYELTNSRVSNEKNDSTATNTTAKNLKEFIESVQDNRGYYIARYEATYGSGYDSSSSTPYANAKPLSKKSHSTYNPYSMDYSVGTKWDNITQPNAATVSRNMYLSNVDVGVSSDLCNSYAWDTAIVYVQAMGFSTFATMKGSDAGLNFDPSVIREFCHIVDMNGMCSEWTTEYSTNANGNGVYFPCVVRGGSASVRGYSVASRSVENNSKKDGGCSFRVILWSNL